MFKTQVRVKEYNAGAMIYVWYDIHPVGGPPYLYATKEDAWSACERANDGRQTRADYRVIDVQRNAEV